MGECTPHPLTLPSHHCAQSALEIVRKIHTTGNLYQMDRAKCNKLGQRGVTEIHRHIVLEGICNLKCGTTCTRTWSIFGVVPHFCQRESCVTFPQWTLKHWILNMWLPMLSLAYNIFIAYAWMYSRRNDRYMSKGVKVNTRDTLKQWQNIY